MNSTHAAADESITLTLKTEGALVLFEFLSRYVEKGSLTIDDQAEQRVLWDVQAQLEAVLVQPLDARYRDLLKRAREAVRDAAQ